MAQDNDTRVYGMADQDNREPPATQGLRGERTPDEGAPELERLVALGDGDVVRIEEESGVGFAEETGRAGLVEPTRAWIEPEPQREPDAETRAVAAPPRYAVLYGWLTAAVGLLVAAVAIRSRQQRQRTVQRGVAPADHVGQAVVDSYVGVDPRVGGASGGKISN